MKLFSGLIGLIILVLALCFALANRQSSTISLWPFGVEVVAPLYLLTLGTLFCGFLAGAIIAWFNMLPHRLNARRLRKEIALLHEKIGDLQQTVLAPRQADASLLTPPKPKWRFWEKSL